MEKPPSGKGPLGGADASGDAGQRPTDEELLADCRIDTFRAGGKGGQHQNKTESGIRLTHRPSGIVVTVRESPSQARNRRAAVSRLRDRLEARAKVEKVRVPTRTPLKERRKRVDDKRKKSKLKRLRKAPERDD